MRYSMWTRTSRGTMVACILLMLAGVALAGGDDPPGVEFLPMPLPDAEQQAPPPAAAPPCEAVVFDRATGTTRILDTPGDALLTSLQDWRPGAEALPATEPADDAGDKNFGSLQRVSNPATGRYPTHVKLYMTFATQGGDTLRYVASGTLIDPYHVVTAGHCVFSRHAQIMDWASYVEVVPAYDDGDEPYGSAYGYQFMSWTGWTGSGDFRYDVGLISLDRPLGALTGWRGFGYHESCDYFTTGTWWHNGYPAESPYDGQDMYTQHGDFDGCSGSWGFARFNRRSYGGQSGSGAVRSDVVRAVLSSGTTSYTNDARIASFMFQHVVEHLEDDRPDSYDLMPIALNVPASSVRAGEALRNVSFMVLNYSEASRAGTWSYTAYLSTDDNITTNDVAIGSGQFSNAFAPLERLWVNAPALSIPDGLDSGYYRVGVIVAASDARTYNNDSSGAHTDVVYVSCPDPDVPANVSATDDLTLRIDVTWEAADDADRYRLYRDGGLVDELTATRYEDEAVEPQRSYLYRVVAVNDCGASDPSTVVAGRCLPAILSVWPGDLDDDGVVAMTDILPLATHWHATGAARDARGADWSGHPVEAWSEPTATYADADGDGRVDMGDFLPICLNWGRTHASDKAASKRTELTAEVRARLRWLHDQIADQPGEPAEEIRRYLRELLGIATPAAFTVRQNHPNPFNPSTTIEYALPAAAQVTVHVYGLDGRLVRTLVDEPRPAGVHAVIWNGRDDHGRAVAAGAYVYRVVAGEHAATRKMNLVK